MSDPKKLQHQIDVAERMAATVSDKSTAHQFVTFANEGRQRLQRWLAWRRRREIRVRAYELWEQAGKPAGREEEFWLTAEREFMQKGPRQRA